ncbi:MAG: outer membrane beta-barrel protein, partial [Bacteroidales bacterium]|nr:outer membrane beta-barrel protein [Bacteroidales bacterium]
NEKNPREPQMIIQKGAFTDQPEKTLTAQQNVGGKGIAGNSNRRGFSPENKKAATSASNEILINRSSDSLIAEAAEKTDPTHEAQGEDSRSDVHREKRHHHDDQHESPFDMDLSRVRGKNRSAKWATSLYASNLSSGSAKTYQNRYVSFVSGELPLETDEEEPVVGDDPFGDILVENKYREVYTDVRHKQPLIVGASVNYSFDDRWSLTSGLTCIILSSQLRSGSEGNYYTSEQTLYNVGIPLSISYNVWKSQHTSVYVSGGGLVEKNVSGKLTTDYFLDNTLISGHEDKISIDPLQWSLNTSVGVQYNFTPTIGLYAEPGVSYYFQNGSEVETIYKEKPVHFSLRFGLRFSLL